ncbi:MAG: chemotaxis protein CheA [Rhizomicrobium sp.]
MDPLESIKQGYFQECEELLLAMEEGLIAMESGDRDSEIINAVFRAVHSIKGGGGAFGFEYLVAFAHSFETVMDLIRSGELDPEAEVMKVLLRAGDMLSDHVAAARSGQRLDPSHDEDSMAELKALSGKIDDEEDELTESFEELGFHQVHPTDLDGGGAAMDLPSLDEPLADLSAEPEAPAEVAEDAAPEAAAPVAEPGWLVHFTPAPTLYAKANEPALLLREMSSLGRLEATAHFDTLPTLKDLDPELAYLHWTIRLYTDAAQDKVEEVFDFASDDCTLVFQSLDSIEPEPAADDAASGGDVDLGADDPGASEPGDDALGASDDIATDVDVADDSVATDEVEEVADAPAIDELAPAPAAPAPAPLALVPSEPAPVKLVAPVATAAPAAKAEDKTAAASGENAIKQTIRVDLDKVERLGNVVGELVITQAMLAQHLIESRGAQMSPMLANNMAEFEHLLRELQEGVMAIRTQPVKSVFQRMPRLVRELAAQTNKQVRLVIKGESTEVDKTVIERLGDPLTHMIRNAVDHGLEPEGDRMDAGKDPEGTVTLSAEHRGGRIVIEVSDDGRGIDRVRVREKAIEKGLISTSANLSDEEIDNLIFLPGFSTAATISSISGRGVGMDVVRSSVADLGGRIIMTSVPGQGSRFTMTLPLTLAVLDGMVVAVGDQTFVLPLTHIIESLQPHADDIRPFGSNSFLLRVRDVYVPLVKVGELLDVKGAGSDPAKGVVILVESEGTGRVALAVDQILGQRQVVIKSFEGNYRHIEGIGAATILGDGRVALIIDVDGVVSRCRGHSTESNLNEVSATGTGP